MMRRRCHLTLSSLLVLALAHVAGCGEEDEKPTADASAIAVEGGAKADVPGASPDVFPADAADAIVNVADAVVDAATGSDMGGCAERGQSCAVHACCGPLVCLSASKTCAEAYRPPGDAGSDDDSGVPSTSCESLAAAWDKALAAASKSCKVDNDCLIIGVNDTCNPRQGYVPIDKGCGTTVSATATEVGDMKNQSAQYLARNCPFRGLIYDCGHNEPKCNKGTCGPLQVGACGPAPGDAGADH